MSTNKIGTNLADRFAAIVDIENTVIHRGLRLPCAVGSGLLEVVQDHVLGMQTRVATGEHVLREYMTSLVRLGWGITAVPTEPDAADDALLAAARYFIDRGVTDLVVVSGDHAFVELASRARLHVISHANHLSRQLRLAATTVTYLPPIATDAWHPARAA